MYFLLLYNLPWENSGAVHVRDARDVETTSDPLEVKHFDSGHNRKSSRMTSLVLIFRILWRI